MKSKIIVSSIIAVTLLCVICLIMAGHGAYVKIKANEYASQGQSCFKQQQYSRAIEAYSRSLQLSPHQPRVIASRGLTYVKLKQYDQAILDYSAALTMVNGKDAISLGFCAKLHYYRARSYDDLHRDREELADLQSSLLLLPESMRLSSPLFSEANNVIGWKMATSPDSSLRNGGEALRYAQQAVTSAHGTQRIARCTDTLAAAEARVGQYSIAVTKQQYSIDLLDGINDMTDSQYMRQRLLLYQQGKPYTADYTAIR